MLRKEDITTIFMDVDDTLLDFKECAREDVRNCCLKNGITYSDDLFEFFLRRNVILWKRIEDGEACHHPSLWRRTVQPQRPGTTRQ